MTLENATNFKDYIVGKGLYYGEIAGKHSDVIIYIKEYQLSIVNNNDVINSFIEENGYIDESHDFLYALNHMIESGIFSDDEILEIYGMNGDEFESYLCDTLYV